MDTNGKGLILLSHFGIFYIYPLTLPCSLLMKNFQRKDLNAILKRVNATTLSVPTNLFKTNYPRAFFRGTKKDLL